MRRRQLLIITLLTASILITPMLLLGRQTQDRTLNRLTHPRFTEPLEFTRVSVNGQDVTFGQKIAADNTWPSGLTFDVKNTSGKKIEYFLIELYFGSSQANNAAPPMLLSYGSCPPKSDGTSPASTKLPAIAPGGSASVTISSDHYKSYRLYAEKNAPNAVLDKTLVQLRTVIFDDDTMWAMGTTLRRDPNNPNKWNNPNASPIGQAEDKGAGKAKVSFTKSNYLEGKPPSSRQSCMGLRSVLRENCSAIDNCGSGGYCYKETDELSSNAYPDAYEDNGNFYPCSGQCGTCPAYPQVPYYEWANHRRFCY